MGSPQKNRKVYGILEISKVITFDNIPSSYVFTIAEVNLDFKRFILKKDKTDDIAWAFAVVAWRKRNNIEASTIISHMNAIDRFFEFISTEKGSVGLNDFNQSLINEFIYWLKFVSKKRLNKDENLSETSKSKYWGVIRDYIRDLIIYGMLSPDLEIPVQMFNLNEFESFKPYTENEVKQILYACIKDTKSILLNKDIVINRGNLSPYLAVLVPHALLLSLRTGINPEVLFNIEITSISIKESHILNSKILVLPIKKRSGKSQNIELKEEIEKGVRVKSNVARLLEEVERITGGARSSLQNNSPLKNKLWLVKPDSGPVDTFNKFRYFLSLQSFSKRHNIIDEFGNLVEINFKRFRPTFAEAMFKLNGGDVRDLQKRLGHTNLATTMGYLDPNLAERVKAFEYAGKTMVEWAFKGEKKPSIEQVANKLEISLETAQKFSNGDFNMGVAKCKDPFNSPLKGIKSGELCTEYLACFRCGNCVVLKEDNHRLFSFYHWILSKKLILGEEKWKSSYSWIIDIIDNDIAPKLGDLEWVSSRKIEAKSDPFPMWAI